MMIFTIEAAFGKTHVEFIQEHFQEEIETPIRICSAVDLRQVSQ